MDQHDYLRIDTDNLKSIEGLSDYIKLLEEYPSADFTFRGENSKYDARLAGAFRGKKQGRLIKSINEYYSTVGHRLSDIEKQNFLAFAQHYGLPTNLLDVTSNPLNALFFACHEAKENGYVYIFSNRDFIDITEIIEAFPREGVFDLFISGNPIAINKIHNSIREMFEGARGLFRFTGEAFVMEGSSYINQLFCKLYCITRDKYSEKNQNVISTVTYEELINRVKGDGVVRARELSLDFYKAVNAERELFEELREAVYKDDIMSDMSSSKIPVDDLMYYISFMLYCFRVEYRCKGNPDLKVYQELFPPMIYRPKITFERARQQQGYFVYMPYMAASGMYSDIEIEMHNVSHIQAIEVINPKQVLYELDNIGVNYGTIYGDFDSIAKYIKEKNSDKKL